MALTLHYAGQTFALALDLNNEVVDLLRDRLNLTRHRRDDLRARTFHDAKDVDLRTVEGHPEHHAYDPFVTLPLVGGGAVTVHLHDGVDIAVVDDGTSTYGTPTITNEFGPVVV